MLRCAVIALGCALLAAADDAGMPDFGGGDFGGGGGGFGGMGGGKSCPKYKCAKGYEAAPKRPLSLSGSGCGGMGGGMIMSMGKEEPEEMEACCNRRTACFQTCGSSKKTCDKEFDSCVDVSCSEIVDPDAKEKCESSAKLQKMMAGFGDCREYDAAQAAGCQCMAPEKAVARREKLLADFYKKHAPSDVGKVAGLAAKAGANAQKFAALLSKLVAKYPKAIKIKKSEQQDYMDKIMREARDKPADAPAEAAAEPATEAGGDDVDDLDALLHKEL